MRPLSIAVIALIAVPVSLVAAMTIGKRAQGRFAAMWKSTGDLNAQIEEAYTGHALVKVFGREKSSREAFRAENQELYRASFKAQFLSNTMMPATAATKGHGHIATGVGAQLG